MLERFVNRDPIGYFGGIDLYEYVGDRSTTYTDPRGTDSFDWRNVTSSGVWNGPLPYTPLPATPPPQPPATPKLPPGYTYVPPLLPCPGHPRPVTVCLPVEDPKIPLIITNVCVTVPAGSTIFRSWPPPNGSALHIPCDLLDPPPTWQILPPPSQPTGPPPPDVTARPDPAYGSCAWADMILNKDKYCQTHDPTSENCPSAQDVSTAYYIKNHLNCVERTIDYWWNPGYVKGGCRIDQGISACAKPDAPCLVPHPHSRSW